MAIILPAVITLSKDPNSLTRATVVNILGEIIISGKIDNSNKKQAFSCLLGLLNDKDHYVRREGVGIIKKITRKTKCSYFKNEALNFMKKYKKMALSEETKKARIEYAIKLGDLKVLIESCNDLDELDELTQEYWQIRKEVDQNQFLDTSEDFHEGLYFLIQRIEGKCLMLGGPEPPFECGYGKRNVWYTIKD